MGFTERDLGQLLWCVCAVLRARRDGILPGGEQRWLRDLVRRIELDLAVSRSRQQSDGDEEHSDCDEWIGSQRVAAMLGRDLRWVQRHAADMGGQKVARQLVFRESAVRDYVEGLNDGRSSA